MADYIRELVSGNKARFKDSSLNTNLDLSYITDQLIIMGFPASGIEGLYRNKRQDAQKFLKDRHGNNFWVFNFCPVKENSYEKEVFDGRVSRWPFPDHHAPPLAVLPLVAREMKQWLQGSPERVAVLHCKAGKGRSGTLACAYILTLPEATPPQLPKSFTSKQLAAQHAEQTIQQIERVESTSNVRARSPLSAEEEKASDSDSPVKTTLSAASTAHSLESVLDLHSSRRMKPAKDSTKVRRGVSIPSQRRWLYYWSLILNGDAPTGFGGFWDPAPSSTIPNQPTPPSPFPKKIRITQLTMRMRKPSSLKAGLVQAANTLIEKTSSKESASMFASGKMWASLARYDDDLVEELGRRYREDETHEERMFVDDKWDKHKMVRSFRRFKATETSERDAKDKKIKTYVYDPISDPAFKTSIASTFPSTPGNSSASSPSSRSSPQLSEEQRTSLATAMHDDISEEDLGSTPTLGTLKASKTATAASTGPKTHVVDPEAENKQGVVVDAQREIRIKLYMGQVFLAWAWIIPLFHMPLPPSGSSSSSSPQSATTTPQRNINGGAESSGHPSTGTRLVLSMENGAKELDFALGIGAEILDLAVDMEWVEDASSDATTTGVVSSSGAEEERRESELDEKNRAQSADSAAGKTGIAKTIQAVAEGGLTSSAVDAKQATEDV